jgi:putative ABC transport system permease protein
MALLLNRGSNTIQFMLRNYFLIARRNLLKNPVFSFINVIGLSLGMAAFILIFQYISFEKSVNGFHSNLPNLYRILFEVSFQGETHTWESVPPALGPLAKDQFAEVNKYCRVIAGSGNGVVTFEKENKQEPKSFREEKIVYADGNFFQVFSFGQQIGNANGIELPNTVAISKASALKYFEQENPIGKVLTLNNQFGKTLYTVTSVYADFPANSDLQYDMVFSLQTLANPANLNGNSWASLESLDTQFIETYLLLNNTADYRSFESKLNEVKKKLRSEAEEIIRLQPMTSMHLPSSLSDYYRTSGNLKFIYILQGIAVLILVIAWFNYINLSTASAMKRAKEVGIRKVNGATKAQLIRQFLGESLLMNLGAFMIALAIVNIIQKMYNELIEKNLSLSLLTENQFWLVGLLLLVVGSLGSGAYTSFALSSFKPSETLKGIFSNSDRGQLLRKSLVVFQFTISIILIASTLVLYRQLSYMQNEDLGVKVDQLVVLSGPEVIADTTIKTRTRAFRNELNQQAFVADQSMSGSVPSAWYNYSTSGFSKTNPQPGDEKISYSIMYIDERFLPLYQIKILAGKNFTIEDCSKGFVNNEKIIINERASKLLGFESSEKAVGQLIVTNNEVIADRRKYEIVAVITDYHHQSLHKAIEPLIIYPMNNAHYFTVKISTDRVQENMKQLEKLYKQYFPGNPFEFFFVDENYNKQYKAEQQYGLIFTLASLLAIFIACLGLFGLASFTVEQRIKEIGIRKVLGASVFQISKLVSKDFFILVTISIIIATPVSWYAMNQWLQGFPYRTEITWWIFGIAGLVAVIIAIATVSSQAIKAALSNPVESLRSE